jgi:hypothetical protein
MERKIAGQRLREAIIVRHSLSKLAATSDKFWLPHAW